MTCWIVQFARWHFHVGQTRSKSLRATFAGGLELDVEWRDVEAAAALEQPGAAWAAGSAAVWRLSALSPQPPASRSLFTLQVRVI